MDAIYRGLAGLLKAMSHALSRTETGRVRTYAAGIAVGAVILILVVLVS